MYLDPGINESHRVNVRSIRRREGREGGWGQQGTSLGNSGRGGGAPSRRCRAGHGLIA